MYKRAFCPSPPCKPSKYLQIRRIERTTTKNLPLSRPTKPKENAAAAAAPAPTLDRPLRLSSMPPQPSVSTAWTFAFTILGVASVFPTALGYAVYGDGVSSKPAPKPAEEAAKKK